jgi:DNA-binding transcriptional ArsR family regulator
VATDINETTVSQSLRLLRTAGTVVARRDGRIIRYELADEIIAELLRNVSSPEKSHRHHRAVT